MSVASKRRVRVVVVDLGESGSGGLTRRLEADGEIEVIGRAMDASDPVALVERLRPDVVALDLTVAGGRGLRVIEQIMGYAPTPILVVSSAVADIRSPAAVEALMAGALDAMAKPAAWTPAGESDLRRRVRLLHGTPVIRHPRGRLGSTDALGVKPAKHGVIVAVAASSGGPPALATVISGLAGVNAPVLIVQHIHANFIDSFVAWMQRVSPLPVNVAAHGDRLLANAVYVAPGGSHMRVAQDHTIVLDPNPATIHRPSADELFFSLAKLLDAKCVAALLTGMGEDGAQGLLAIRTSGGFTLAQDEATSAVYGMPAAAARMGAACRVVPIREVAPMLVGASKSAGA
jgi:two-component system, chemotaxis family, protein-glutamate methylesterase/glutaminase